MNVIKKKIIIKDENISLIDALSNHTDLSKQVLKSALDKGCVWLKTGKKINRVRRVKKPLKKGSEVFLYFNENILSSIPTKPELLLDKQTYSVWFKPAGVFAQGSKWGDHCALTRLVEKITHRDSFLVHRLDRATSGIMVIAHNNKMAAAFSKLFAERQINKVYLAIVNGEFPNKTVSIDDKIDGKTALSHVSLLEKSDGRSLLKVEIETGRKHQIRKHLSAFGFAIIGDRMYGNAPKNYPENLQLQAISLAFNCPIDKKDIALVLAENKKIML